MTHNLNRARLIDLLYAYTGRDALDYDLDATADELLVVFGNGRGIIPEGTLMNFDGELDRCLESHRISYSC